MKMIPAATREIKITLCAPILSDSFPSAVNDSSFLLVLTAAGLTPSVNILVKKITPSAFTGRVFGFTMSAGYLGVFGGSVLGGQVAATLGSRYVFIVTGALLLINAAWIY